LTFTLYLNTESLDFPLETWCHISRLYWKTQVIEMRLRSLRHLYINLLKAYLLRDAPPV